MDITKLIEQFSTPEELKIFIAAQFKQIQQLSKENKELKEKLSTADKNKKALVKSENLSVTLPLGSLSVQDDAKTISQIQLNILKELSFERELTTDEAKRVELFNRILIEEVSKDKKLKKADVEIISASELLKLVE